MPHSKVGARSSKIAASLEASFAGLMSGINTTIPGYFLSFDAATQLAQIQIAIKLIDADGKVVGEFFPDEPGAEKLLKQLLRYSQE